MGSNSNAATTVGGGSIYALGKVQLLNCSFVNNTVISSETTISAAGGAIYGGPLSSIRIFNTTFRSNVAT
jgi:hypothetical protein